MEQLEIPRPFGTEGCQLSVRFAGHRWLVDLREWTGDRWAVLDQASARSSDRALAEAIRMLAEYRDALASPDAWF